MLGFSSFQYNAAHHPLAKTSLSLPLKQRNTCFNATTQQCDSVTDRAALLLEKYWYNYDSGFCVNNK